MIKRVFFTILCLLVIVGTAFAEGTVVQTPVGGTYYSKISEGMKITTFTITDDAGSVPTTDFLDPERIFGWHIMTVEAKSSSDDSLTVTIQTDLGSNLFNNAYTAASSGEIVNTDDRWPVYSTLSIDVTNMSGDTVTVIVTFVQ